MKGTDPRDQAILDSFLQRVARVPEEINPTSCQQMAADEAEGYIWKIMPYLRMPLTAYRITGDARYADIFVQTFEHMRSALTAGPDGFLGWRGKALEGFQDPDHPEAVGDVMISDFAAVDTVSQCLEAIGASPELSERYAAQRAEYLDLMENHFIKKWDARGNYIDLGQTGAIYNTEAGLKYDKTFLTQPHNKQSTALRALLSLSRVTGEDEYLRKAIKLGIRFKHCLALRDGHYEWDYWDPAGAWDIMPEDRKGADASVRLDASASPHATTVRRTWKHWIGPEHRGGYYTSSLSQAIALYHYGLVFDRTDLDRFLRTQMERCWNGDLEHPVWSRVDGTRPAEYTQGEYISGDLAPFNEKIAHYLFSAARQNQYLEYAATGSSWQAGAMTAGWLAGKLLRASDTGGKQRHLEFGERFLSKPENRAFLQELDFEVTPPGYQPPRTPAEMREMPKQSGSR